MHKTEKLKSFIKLSRIKTLVWFCVATCLGFSTVILNEVPPIKFIIWVLTVIFANIGAIIINDLGDIPVDSKSHEFDKRNRPIASGAVSKKEAIIYCILSFSMSIAVSFIFGLTATFFSLIILLFSLSYSLKPFKFCARPYASILFWVILCLVSYFSMILALQNMDSRYGFTFTDEFIYSKSAGIYTLGILLFMGIAEIIAKDIRDKENDAEGGRNTFVNHSGMRRASTIMIFFAWAGYLLWVNSLSLANVFPGTIAAWLCAIVGFLWCIRIGQYSLALTKQYQQPLAARLHGQWALVYFFMQLFTIIAFIE